MPSLGGGLPTGYYRDLARRRTAERRRLIAKGLTPGTHRLEMLVARNLRRRRVALR